MRSCYLHCPEACCKVVQQGPRYYCSLQGAMGKPIRSEASQNLEGGLGVPHSAFHFFSPPDISAKDVGIAGFAASANLVVLMKVRKNTG